MYKVVISKITLEKVDTRDYKIVGKEEDGENNYGYVHDYEEKDVERKVLEQLVEELDINAVIKAVNGLEK